MSDQVPRLAFRHCPFPFQNERTVITSVGGVSVRLNCFLFRPQSVFTRNITAFWIGAPADNEIHLPALNIQAFR